MAFSLTTNSRGRGRLGSASTSSLSSIGTPPATDSFFSLTHQHQSHLESQFNPPIDPQLFGLAAEATLSENSLASSSVIAGEVVAGGSTETYSDTERLPSLGISVSGDEEDERKEEGKQDLKLEGLEEGVQQQFPAAVDGASASDLRLWDRVELQETGPALVAQRRPSNSTLDLSEPEIDSDSNREDEEQKEPLETPTLPTSSLPPGKRKRGRPRKYPLPVDSQGVSIHPPKSKKRVNTWGKKVPKGASMQTSPLENKDGHGVSMPTNVGERQDSTLEMRHNELGEEVSDASDTSETPETPDMPDTPLASRRKGWETTTPTFSRRGPGRPKKYGSRNMTSPDQPPAPDTSTIQSQHVTISDMGAQETPTVKRGPGRPRKTKFSVVGDGSNSQPGTTNREFAAGWRRSARERRSGLGTFRRKSLAEEDLKAPVMGQGSLKRVKKLVNYPTARTGGNGSCGEGEERSISRNERKGYVKKAELDRIRRGRCSTSVCGATFWFTYFLYCIGE